MAGRLQDKVAIVTGAGSVGAGWGNGKATAVLFAREGAKVLAVDLNAEAAEETRAIVEGEGGICTTFRADVSEASEVEAMVQACLDAFGRVDILHNNVGIGALGGAAETTEEDWDRLHKVNLKSIFLCCRAVLPEMERQGGGAIVNISSVGGIRWIGIPYIAYASSKGAILQVTQSIALEYAAKGIRCNAVLPGLMDTPMIYASIADHYGDREEVAKRRNAASPTGKMGDAWDVAYAALYLASDEAKYVNGTHIIVDGGLSARAV